MTFEELCIAVQTLLTSHAPKSYPVRLRREAQLANEFIKHYSCIVTTRENDIPINSEKIYLCMHNLLDVPLSICGHVKKFIKYDAGYSEVCIVNKLGIGKCDYWYQKSLTPALREIKRQSMLKAIDTIKEKYEVDNISQLPEQREIRREKSPFSQPGFNDSIHNRLKDEIGNEAFFKRKSDMGKKIYNNLTLDEKSKASEKSRKSKLITYYNRLQFTSVTKLFTVEEFEGVGNYYNKKYLFKCNACSTQFMSGIMSYSGNEPQCPTCNFIGTNVSKEEHSLYLFVKSLLPENILIITSDRTEINPYELDIYIPHLKLAFEYHGVFWHNEFNKDHDLHYKKFNLCKDKGIELVTVFSDIWEYKKEYIKSYITSLITKTSNNSNIEFETVTPEYAYDFMNTYSINGIKDLSMYMNYIIKSTDEIGLVSFEIKDSICTIKELCLKDYSYDIYDDLVSYITENFEVLSILLEHNSCYPILTNFETISKSGYEYFIIKSASSKRFNDKKLLESNEYYRVFDCGYETYKML